jgi:hypothetical protein
VLDFFSLITPKEVAFGAVMLCVIATTICAQTFAKRRPRIFYVLALFALSWALLLPFYGTPVASDILPAFGGFLMVCIGGLLRREQAVRAKEPTRKTSEQNDEIEGIDRRALWLLLAFAFPPLLLHFSFPNFLRFLQHPAHSELIPLMFSSLDNPIIYFDIKNLDAFINKAQQVGTINVGLHFLGFVSMCQGTMQLYGEHERRRHWPLVSLVALAAVYLSLEVYYLTFGLQHAAKVACPVIPCLLTSDPNFWASPSPLVSNGLLCAFALMKCLYTVTFLYLILEKIPDFHNATGNERLRAIRETIGSMQSIEPKINN